MDPFVLRDTVQDEPAVAPVSRYDYGWLVAALTAVLVAAVVAYYYYFLGRHVPPAAQLALPGAPLVQPPGAAPDPGPAHPMPVPRGAEALPALEQSDTLMRHALVALLGERAFNQLVLPVELVRRIVATVDNLPRPTAPRRMIPLAHVQGMLRAEQSGEAYRLSPANYPRYEPYVRVFESVDAADLVRRYAGAYPLFQRAYEELGFPGRHFNDRLVLAIEDLLAAPEAASPPELLRPKVLYEFADPDLETRSAGQKILLRMGPENAARVKAKLREIRSALAEAAR